MVYEIKLSNENYEGKAGAYDQVCQDYLALLVKISTLNSLESVNFNFATLLGNVVMQVDRAQRKVR